VPWLAQRVYTLLGGDQDRDRQPSFFFTRHSIGRGTLRDTLDVSTARSPGSLKPRVLNREVGELLLWALDDPPDSGYSPQISPGSGDELIEAAKRHGVVALVHDTLKASGVIGQFDPSTRKSLSTSRLRATAEHLRVSAELASLAQALDSSDIPWAVLKGPAVAWLGYPSPTARWFCDLDVLVGAEDFGRAIDMICEAGARLVDLNWDLQLRLLRSEASLLLPFRTALDLHWHPVNNAAARAQTNFDVPAMLSRRRFIPAMRGVIPVLDAADNMLTVALHGALSGGHRLTWLKDLQCLARRDPPEWELLARRSATAHVGVPVAVMLRRSTRLLHADVPPSTIARLIGGHSWANLCLLAEQLAQPSSFARGTGTGTTLMSSLRDSPTETALALTRAQQRHLTATLQERGAKLIRRNSMDRRSALASSPLWKPSGGPVARARYLAAINDRSGTSATQASEKRA
jgi:putative nucleotidyltransferase-like protein